MTDLSDLDSLLSESLEEIAAKKLEKQRDKVHRKWTSNDERNELRKKIQKAEVQVDWQPIAACALISEQVCLNCGTRHRHFEGLFQYQRHKRMNSVFKYVPALDHTMTDNLPHFQRITQSESDLCASCCSSQGWLDESIYLTEEETPHVGNWNARQTAKNRQKHSNEYQPAGGFGRKD